MARVFIVQHHYSKSFVVDRFNFGLHRHGRLVGVATFSVPVSIGSLSKYFGNVPALELGRFVLLDQEPANAESWFLARCFAVLPRLGIEGVLSFTDPTPRSDKTGHVIFPGHVGTIYQATNGRYLGRSTPRTLL